MSRNIKAINPNRAHMDWTCDYILWSFGKSLFRSKFAPIQWSILLRQVIIWNIKKPKNDLWFNSPTQHPIQWQWWSYLRTHLLHSLQCFARYGSWLMRQNSQPRFLGITTNVSLLPLLFCLVFFLHMLPISKSSADWQRLDLSGFFALALFSTLLPFTWVYFELGLNTESCYSSSTLSSSSELNFRWS